jgi:hypothetical protein
MLSDERTKTDIAGVGSAYGSKVASAYGMGNDPISPYSAVNAAPPQENFLDWKYQAPAAAPEKKGPLPMPDMDSISLSDERAKRDVERMDDGDLVDWAKRVPAVTFRYKTGIEDGGVYPHVGTTAQALEQSGPLGRMMVHEDDDGKKHVDYGALAFMQARAALKAAEKGRRSRG